MKYCTAALVFGGLMEGVGGRADIVFTLEPQGSGYTSDYGSGSPYIWSYDVTTTGGAWVNGWAAVVILDVQGYLTGTATWSDEVPNNSNWEISETLSYPNAPNDPGLTDLILEYSGQNFTPDSPPLDFMGTFFFQSTIDTANQGFGAFYLQWFDENDELPSEIGLRPILLPTEGGGQGEVPEASSVVAVSAFGVLAGGYWMKKRRQA